VLAIAPQALPRFAAIAERERCPFAVIGETDASGQLAVRDPLFADQPVDMPLEVLLGKPPRLTRDVRSVPVRHRRLDTARIQLREAAYRVLRLPAVADKTFLITIGDRTVGGLISRDQLVGPWQVPVSDVAVSSADYHGTAGEAMAMGERTPVAVLDAPASGRSRSPRRSPTSSRPISIRCRTSACRPTGWPPAVKPARMRLSTLRCRRWARSCARSSVSRFPSARTRCR